MAKTGEGMIPRSDFEVKVRAKKVFETPSWKEPVIYRVLELLKRCAMTRKTLARNLDVSEKTVTNAIHHLKRRKNLDIRRYYNPEDGEFYYYLHRQDC